VCYLRHSLGITSSMHVRTYYRYYSQQPAAAAADETRYEYLPASMSSDWFVGVASCHCRAPPRIWRDLHISIWYGCEHDFLGLPDSGTCLVNKGVQYCEVQWTVNVMIGIMLQTEMMRLVIIN
jgi:hypothetical protein